MALLQQTIGPVYSFLVLWCACVSLGSTEAATCNLQSTSIRITRDQTDEQGALQRTCEGTVFVARCEGTCVSQVQPSITLPHGFLKECNCCRETYMNRREIQLQDCFDPNGQKIYGAEGSMTIFLEEPQECACHKCGL
ncbi:partner of bursicon-like [Ornithodoros turicata]|uniref:partner of bursicon-like n=1 Tax=Ornithodoros turicata TaxID=34597 RepID=UPI003139E2B0